MNKTTAVTDRHRVAAVIESVRAPYLEESHRVLTTDLYLKLGSSAVQGFGGLAFESMTEAHDYLTELCGAFGVQHFVDLRGKRCFALYSFGKYNELVEGLESVDTGRRFVQNAWRAKHCPGTPSVLEQKQAHVRAEVARMERQIAESKTKLDALAREFVDWADPELVAVPVTKWEIK